MGTFFKVIKKYLISVWLLWGCTNEKDLIKCLKKLNEYM